MSRRPSYNPLSTDPSDWELPDERPDEWPNDETDGLVDEGGEVEDYNVPEN